MAISLQSEVHITEVRERYDYIYSLVNSADENIDDYINEINVQEDYLLELQDKTNFSSLLLSNQLGTMDFMTV